MGDGNVMSVLGPWVVVIVSGAQVAGVILGWGGEGGADAGCSSSSSL